MGFRRLGEIPAGAINVASHIDIPSRDEYGRDFVSHPSVRAISQNLDRTKTLGSGFTFSLPNSTLVQEVLKEIKVNKSPGHDGITPNLLKVSAEIIAAPLSIILNNVIPV